MPGVLRLEFEGHEGYLDAGPGDFVHVPAYTVHRESNPAGEPSLAVIARVGGGIPTVNVTGLTERSPDPDRLNHCTARAGTARLRSMRVLILGAGFGGLELAATLATEAGDAVEVTLVDRAEGFVFGFSKLDVMFGRSTADHVLTGTPTSRRRRAVRATTVRAIDPETKRVETDAGPLDCDVLVVALGADLHPEATPGLVEHGHEFYTVAGAFGLRDVLDDFAGGDVVVAVTSTPFKCPPAPSGPPCWCTTTSATRAARALVGLARDAARRADPAVAGGLGGAARGVRATRHRLAAGRAGALGRAGPRAPRRRHRDAVRPVARRAHPPRARRRGRVRADRGRLDPGRPADPARPASPTCTRSATSPASARPRRASSPRARPRSSPPSWWPATAARRAPRRTTGAGICYLEFGETRSPRWT